MFDVSTFISYRRDEKAAAGRLYDYLCREFGESNVFLDVSKIPPGVDFPAHLSNAITKCHVFVVIIGGAWAPERLHEPNDFVRRELEMALARDVPILPVLLDGTKMPAALTLPESIRRLASINALRVSLEDEFEPHAARLARTIRKRGPWIHRLSRRKLLTGAGLAGVSAVAFRQAPTFFAPSNPAGPRNPEPPRSVSTTIRMGIASSNKPAVDAMFQELAKVVASHDEFRSVELRHETVSNAEGYGTFLASDDRYDLVTIDEPWRMDAAPSLADLEELAESKIPRDAHIPGLLDGCRAPESEAFVCIPFRFNVLLLVTRLDRLRAQLHASAHIAAAPKTFDGYVATIGALERARKTPCPVVYYNEKTNSQAEAFLALYRMRADKPESYTLDGPITFQEAAATPCREMQARLMKGCLRVRGGEQAAELLGSADTGTPFGHCWASWLLKGAGSSDALSSLTASGKLDLGGCSQCPVGGSWMLAVPKPSTANRARRKIAAKLALLLSTSAECQRLLWSAGLFPALDACWATTETAMPTWVSGTFTTADNSMISIAHRTRPRFQTRRWMPKQDALIRYVHGDEVPTDLMKLV